MAITMKSKEKRITIFGDSITKGIIFTDNQYVKLEDSAVDMLKKETKYEINNISVFGQTLSRAVSKGIFSKYIEEVKTSNKKEIAIIALGGNDSDYNWGDMEKIPFDQINSKTPLTMFANYLNNTIEICKQNNVTVYLVTIPPVNAKLYYENVLAKKYNGKLILEFFNGDISNITRHQEAYNMQIMKSSALYNCQLIDVRSEMLMKRDFTSLLCLDGIHPNLEGHKLMYEVIKRQLKVKKDTKNGYKSPSDLNYLYV